MTCNLDLERARRLGRLVDALMALGFLIGLIVAFVAISLYPTDPLFVVGCGCAAFACGAGFVYALLEARG